MSRLAVLPFAALAVLAAPAEAREAQLALKGGRLDEVAIALARATGSSIVVADPALASRRVPALGGRMDAAEAVRRLARAADARALRIGPQAWRIVAAPPRSGTFARRRPAPAPAPPARPEPAPETVESAPIIVLASKRDTPLANCPARSRSSKAKCPHESPLSMLVPLGVLSLGAVLAGQLFAPTFLDSEGFWQGSVFYNEPLIHAMHAVPYLVKYAAFIVMVIGLFVAWLAYIKDPSIPGRTAEQLGPVYRFLYNKWYFDELYHYLFVVPAFWLGRQFWKLGDIGTIDRFGPNGVAWVVEKGSVGARRFQTGYLNSYALVMLLGLVAAVTWVLF